MARDTPVRPLSRRLILGSWRMTSWVTRDVATGERQDALGQNPRGTVVYTPQRVTFVRQKDLPPGVDLEDAAWRCANSKKWSKKAFVDGRGRTSASQELSRQRRSRQARRHQDVPRLSGKRLEETAGMGAKMNLDDLPSGVAGSETPTPQGWLEEESLCS
jgi:Lipocalin-like domain